MKVNQCIVNLNSGNPDKLGAFYRDVIGLEGNPAIGPNAFNAGGTTFLIDGHSEVSGTNSDPPRVLINFFVDDLNAEQSRLESAGVEFIRTAGKEEWGGVISTFVDPDGNYGQLIEFTPPGS
ncbi:MAG: VOC family protein [Chloroflexi bacterium]|nr:VOC family protein [Chloroflexota bacterium]